MSGNAYVENPVILDCIAFYDGLRVSDGDLEDVVELAIDGFITKAGQRLYLIPRQVYEQATRDQQAKADEYARKRRKWDPGFKSGPASPSIKKWDCIPLTNFLPKKGHSRGPRLCENEESMPLIPRLPEGVKRNPCTAVQIIDNSNGFCRCGDSLKHKRSDAKYCSKACKQAAYRQRGQA